MNVLTLIKGGSTAAKQHSLKCRMQQVKLCVEEEDGIVVLSRSEKLVVFPILEGLGIPYIDADVNGVLIGSDMDKLQEIYDSI